ncbi:unnamed protein product [Vitrella brassicaformis CCMP3155]|uniref:Aminoglycoside phosphotransferase domain-containing protein n=4 Tax=Vitrella brassicaformis TaxID=1169539 RepID=A0A0G4FRE4_VITBC|nr:unnamed protein product [Vitrella brassicaformis CCMP3155]|eukprot:CEM16627.1 unnamed protein product [Vitrella brassicaformis CCMP3155]
MESTAASPPCVGEQEAQTVLQEISAEPLIVCGSLPSERDANYLVRKSSEAAPCYVLKISNESDQPSLIDCQNELMAHLARHAGPGRFTVPTPLLLKNGSHTMRTTGGGHLCRLLTYQQGVPLADFSPHDATLLGRVGRVIGHVTSALCWFVHSGAERAIVWSMERCGEVIGAHLGHMSGSQEGDTEVIKRWLERYTNVIEPKMRDLPRGVLHGDLNDRNILVDYRWEGRAGEGTHSVAVIDYGDVSCGPRVSDLAIAMSYVMYRKEEPLACVMPFVAGYHSVHPLTEGEVDVLFDLSLMRLATTVVMAAHHRSIRPENAYLSVSESGALRLLRLLDSTVDVNHLLPRAILRHTCNMAPIPSAPSLHSLAPPHVVRPPSCLAVVDLTSSSHLIECDAEMFAVRGGVDWERRPTDLGAKMDQEMGVDQCVAMSGYMDAWPVPLCGINGPSPSPSPSPGHPRDHLLRDGCIRPSLATTQIGRTFFLRSPAAEPVGFARHQRGKGGQWEVFCPLDGCELLHVDAASRRGTGLVVLLQRVSSQVREVSSASTLTGGANSNSSPPASDCDEDPPHHHQQQQQQAPTTDVYWLIAGLHGPSLDTRRQGRAISKGDIIGPVDVGQWGCAGLEGVATLPPRVHVTAAFDLWGHEADPAAFPTRCTRRLKEVYECLCPDPAVLLGLLPSAVGVGVEAKMSLCDGMVHVGAPSVLAGGKRDPEELKRIRRDVLGRNLSLNYKADPVKVVRGSGQYLYDETGRAYLDCVNNVTHVGHGNPIVVRALQQQMEVLNTNCRYLHDALVEYAAQLLALFPDPLRVVYLVNTGTEANELALRLAQTHTKRRDVLIVDHAYHGNSSGLIGMSPYKCDGKGGSGVHDWVHRVPIPDRYRGPATYDDPQAGDYYASHVERVIRESKRPIAAFFAESVLSCGGQVFHPPDYLSAVYAIVRAHGGVCVADEVQTGFGRVGGDKWWAYESSGVMPDIVAMAKPIGNGHPLAAVVTTTEIAASFDNGMGWFNTYGGNPVSCIVGLSVLKAINELGLRENAHVSGRSLLDGLKTLIETSDCVGDVRGEGLMAGIEMVECKRTKAPAPAKANYVINRMRQLGFLLSTDGPFDNVVKVKPPMLFSVADGRALVDALRVVLKETPMTVKTPMRLPIVSRQTARDAAGPHRQLPSFWDDCRQPTPLRTQFDRHEFDAHVPAKRPGYGHKARRLMVALSTCGAMVLAVLLAWARREG